MNRFPAPEEAAASGAPERDEAELLALAEELRAACPPAPVSGDFAAKVQADLARPWTLGRTLDRSRLARAAATLLVVTLAVAPVVAVLQVLPWFKPRQTEIGMEPFLPAPEVQDQGSEAPVLPAEEAPLERDAVWIESVLRQNRLALAAQSWSRAGVAAPRVRDAASGIVNWETASAEDLWQEFLRTCARGSGSIPGALEARVGSLMAVADAEERLRLAPWLWVLRGELMPARDLAPALAWPGAPWVAH